MKAIDWQKLAKDHDMTPEQFTNELFMTTCAAASIDLERTNDKALEFTCYDGTGTIRMLIKKEG